ncbi:MAG: response regulator [Nostoc sp.]|uniref:response regulator n=1 Tax=Nostoc sp. TaxID=1180 RepID=UPI002FFA8377
MKVAPNLTTARSRLALRTPDVVLLDLSFPGTEEDGLILLSEIVERSPNTRVVVFTGRDTLADRLVVSRLGARQFLHKPATTEQIFQAIARVLPKPKTSDAKVLIVDDDPIMLAGLSALLTPWGMEVTTLLESQRFWEVLIATSPNLVVLDLLAKTVHISNYWCIFLHRYDYKYLVWWLATRDCYSCLFDTGNQLFIYLFAISILD